MLKRDYFFGAILVLFISGTAVSLSGCIGSEENLQTQTIPNILIGVDSYTPPAYKGSSTLVTLVISGINVTKGTEISLSYKTQIWHTDGSWEVNPESVHLTPEQKPLIFQNTVKPGETPKKLYYKLTVDADKNAAEGEYYITISGKDKSLAFGNAVLSFKIGKGGKLPLPKKNVWNIGYSKNMPPPISDEEKEEALAVVANASDLKKKIYEITGVDLSFREFKNFSGFFPVVTVNIREKERQIAIVGYTIDLEDKKVIESGYIPLKPVPVEAPEYFIGQSFDESFGNFTKKWNAENFAGFWRDAGASTETLVINQSILNNSYRIIEKHNLIYTTKQVPLKYQVYAYVNKTPSGTEGFYSAVGWLGEEHVFLQGNRLARIIFEQNASDVKTMHTRESWSLGDGYKITANSIDVPLRGEEQAWITFFKDNNELGEKVLPNNSLYSYPETADGTPTLVTYTSNIYRLPQEDVADFKYTWLRSQNITEIREGKIFGAMEVTSVENGIIELRNKEPIKLAPGTAIYLMGNMGIQVGSSETGLQFYPTTGW